MSCRLFPLLPPNELHPQVLLSGLPPFLCSLAAKPAPPRLATPPHLYSPRTPLAQAIDVLIECGADPFKQNPLKKHSSFLRCLQSGNIPACRQMVSSALGHRTFTFDNFNEDRNGKTGAGPVESARNNAKARAWVNEMQFKAVENWEVQSLRALVPDASRAWGEELPDDHVRRARGAAWHAKGKAKGKNKGQDQWPGQHVTVTVSTDVFSQASAASWRAQLYWFAANTFKWASPLNYVFGFGSSTPPSSLQVAL